MAGMAIWIAAIFDALNPNGLFRGILFKYTAIGSGVGLLFYIFFIFFKEKAVERKEKNVAEEAAVFEPKREEEIRAILRDNPHFATHCYQCKHFNEDLRHCSKEFSKDLKTQRVKEVRIGSQSYCLYWEQSSQNYAGPEGMANAWGDTEPEENLPPDQEPREE